MSLYALKQNLCLFVEHFVFYELPSLESFLNTTQNGKGKNKETIEDLSIDKLLQICED